jgi:hypothetical protein
METFKHKQTFKISKKSLIKNNKLTLNKYSNTEIITLNKKKSQSKR